MNDILTAAQQSYLENSVSDAREREVFENFSSAYRDVYAGTASGHPGLTEEQRAIVRTLEGPVFVSAGAGSGKTFTLTQRVIYALTKGSGGPGESFLSGIDEALIITFTRDAAAEIKERLRAALYQSGMRDQALLVDNAWVSTIHGMCSRIIRENALELGVDPSFSVLEGDEADDVLRGSIDAAVWGAHNEGGPAAALLDEYGTGFKSGSYGSPSTINEIIKTIIEKASEEPDGLDAVVFPGEAPQGGVIEGASPELLAEFVRAQGSTGLLMEIVRKAHAIYTAEKRRRGALDNADLLRVAYDALETSDVVRAKYRNRFKMVMVDEFQDTSTIQYKTIGALAGEGLRYLATVGDAQQSIYRFRGADVEVFKAARADSANTLLEMDGNFRSNDSILQYVEHVCCDESMIPPSDYLHLSAKRNEAKVGVAYAEEGAPRIIVEVADGAGSIGATRPMVAAQIADRLARLRAEKGIEPRDMVLLLGAMTNANIYIDALRARGIESVMTKGSVFSSLPEVKAVENLLSTIANPLDTKGALLPLLTSEMFELDANDLILLSARATESGEKIGPLWSQLFSREAPAEGSGRLQAARATLLRAIDAAGKEEAADTCYRAILDSGWLSRLDADASAVSRAKAANILRALDAMRAFERSRALGLSQLANRFPAHIDEAKLSPAQLAGDKPNVLSVMTIHGSKGLEFPVVAMAEFAGGGSDSSRLSLIRDDGRLICALAPKEYDNKELAECRQPSSEDECSTPLDWYLFARAADDRADLEETARKVYVGLTRAKEALVVGLPFGKDDAGSRTMWAARALLRSQLDSVRATPGVHELAAEGHRYEGICRTVLMEKHDDTYSVESGDELSTPAGEYATPEELAYLHPDAQRPSGEGAHALFAASTPTDEHPFSRHAGIYSFSSASKEMQPHEQQAPAELPDDEDNAAEAFDPDRATRFGSAVHACCEAMVKEGTPPDAALPEERLLEIARYWRVNDADLADKKGLADLRAAVDAWASSALRAKALASYDLVEAEVPFFIHAPSRFGSYLEGFIDLLATRDGGREGLVVDYKTGYLGYDAESFQKAHEMQANFYAHVLLNQGYTSVTCSFIALQQSGADGAPLVASYGPFTPDNPPTLDW